MVKLSGSPNYKMAEITRLLSLVEEHLPLGKDEWERLAMSYNTNRSRMWAERDMDSLRRKFKALYSVRKPTGTAEMPPHIEKAKWAKQAIDDKANVVEMDDAADEDQPDGDGRENEGLFVEPDFSFEPYFEDNDCGGSADLGSSDPAASTTIDTHDTRVGDSTGAAIANAGLSSRTVRREPTLDLQLGDEGLEAFAATPKPSPLPAAPPTRQLRSAGLKKPRKATTWGVDAADTPATTTSAKPPAAHGYQPGSRDEEEATRHKALLSTSNRLGGSSLYAFRDTVGSKRTRESGDTDQAEASFAKTKRIRALKTTTALKQKLADLESASSNLGSSAFEMMLLLREENERKAEARRSEEDLRRRDEAAAKEARLVADKAEVEERRRQDKKWRWMSAPAATKRTLVRGLRSSCC
jgi:hypothetical protein